MNTYILKQNDGFKHKRYHQKDENDIPDLDMYLEVPKGTCIALNQHKLMWQNGEIIENPNYEDYAKKQEKIRKQLKEYRKRQEEINSKYVQIAVLKKQLADSDYRAIKYAEGLYTEEEYAPYKAERQKLRDEINKLEEEVQKL